MAITILVLLEKIVPLNWHLGQVTGVILLAWGG